MKLISNILKIVITILALLGLANVLKNDNYLRYFYACALMVDEKEILGLN
ncbi:MAG: hypothetical protein RSF67_03225 [Clostridia bacterium]